MRKIFIFFLFGVLGLFVFFEYESKHPMVFKEDVGICEGDIVFQTSNSKQSPFIQHATGSKWTHCGELVYDIYKNQLGVEFKLRKVSSYNILGLNKMLMNRGIKLNQLVIAPSDLL